MWKLVGGVVAGIFVGAAICEIMQRGWPNLIHKVEDKARNAVDAFREGYATPGRSREAP